MSLAIKQNHVYSLGMRRALVTKTHSSHRVQISFDLEKGDFGLEANIAVPSYIPNSGDHVLVIPEESGNFFVVGVLFTSNKNTRQQICETENGAGARVSEENGSEVIRVHDHNGNMLFEHYSDSGRSVIYAPNGDLVLNAPTGQIQMLSTQGISLSTLGNTVIESHGVVELRAGDSNEQSQISMKHNTLAINTIACHLSTSAVDLKVDAARVEGQTLDGSFRYAKWAYHKLDLTMDRLVESVGNAVRSVKELLHQRAGSMRTIVEGDLTQQSRSVELNAQETVKIDGKKIHLG